MGLVHETAIDADAADAVVRRLAGASCRSAAPGAVADAKALIRDVAGKPVTDDLRDADRQTHRRPPRLARRPGRARGVFREAQTRLEPRCINSSSPTAARSRGGSSAPRAAWGLPPSRSIPTPTPARRSSARPTSRWPSARRRRGTAYLVGDKIIAAARRTGADAIHPGYGFLSENADFARDVRKAGLVFVGPPETAMRVMALKDSAKAAMKKAGVPITPGYQGSDQSLVRLQRAAEGVGFPLLIKAVAGGGGKGMRSVLDAAEFQDALMAAQREGEASFGNPAVLLEKLIQRPRHVEVQVFGDAHGNAVHLFERDCSLQRRHQKVIEEAPAPGLSDRLRQAMGDAAVTAASAIGYEGAGTVEFILDLDQVDEHGDPAFYFMEMNTRLQVEHPVTECITGLDLVEWQLRVARGEMLPLMQDAIAANGWAMEARLYAEDADGGFLPSTGTLSRLRFGSGEGVRIDTGVETGSTIGLDYDPMIAKVIAWGPDRATAIDRLVGALDGTVVEGLKSNRAFLARLADHPEFRSGNVDTGFIGRHAADLVPDRRSARGGAAAGGARPAADRR